jgi:hypothetical protein
MNQSDSGKKSSSYWNLPTVHVKDGIRDDFRTASLLSLTMTLSLAKTLGAQSPTMLLFILRNLLESWCVFEPLSFQGSSTATLSTLNSFESFALEIMNPNYFPATEPLKPELLSAAASLLLAIGLLRGSAELITKSANFVLQNDVKLDSRIFNLIKEFGGIELNYTINFPQKLVKWMCSFYFSRFYLIECYVTMYRELRSESLLAHYIMKTKKQRNLRFRSLFARMEILCIC